MQCQRSLWRGGAAATHRKSRLSEARWAQPFPTNTSRPTDCLHSGTSHGQRNLGLGDWRGASFKCRHTSVCTSGHFHPTCPPCAQTQTHLGQEEGAPGLIHLWIASDGLVGAVQAIRHQTHADGGHPQSLDRGWRETPQLKRKRDRIQWRSQRLWKF